MRNPPGYIYLINFLLNKTANQEGYDHDEIVFKFTDLHCTDIDSMPKLASMLNRFCKDKVPVEGESSKKTVIDSYEISEETIKLFNVTTERLERFKYKISGNEIKIASSRVLPISTNSAIKWENITIKFLNGHDVEIYIKNGNIETKIEADCKRMDCYNSKTKKPNKQWELLTKLSENNGQLSWGSIWANNDSKKQKQILSDRFKYLFSKPDKKDPPFYSYRKNKSYVCKITLIPIGEIVPRNLLADRLSLETRIIFNELVEPEKREDQLDEE